MDDRLATGLEPGRGELVRLDAGLGGLQRPRLVRDHGGDQPAPAEREEAVALDQKMLERAGLGWLGVPELMPRRELAYAFVTFYLGVNLMTQLDEDRARTDALFARLEAVAPLLPTIRIGPDG